MLEKNPALVHLSTSSTCKNSKPSQYFYLRFASLAYFQKTMCLKSAIKQLCAKQQNNVLIAQN